MMPPAQSLHDVICAEGSTHGASLAASQVRPVAARRWTQRLFLVVLLLLLSLGACATVQGQRDGTPQPTQSLPTATVPAPIAQVTPPRTGASMAYDAGQGVVVLFGGIVPSGVQTGPLDDTWAWDGTTWAQQHPATTPPARGSALLAYDAAHRQLVLFGGSDGNGHLFTDTWTWNDGTWTQQHPASTPSPRTWASTAYDVASQQLVLFGGEAPTGAHAGTLLADTWVWNGSTWIEQHPANAPSPRSGAALVYDAATRQLVLFGGRGTGPGGLLDDTWTWNGSTWTQQHLATAPSPRAYASSAYDQATQHVYLFGGSGATSESLTDVWQWSGTSWEQTTTKPYAPQGQYLAVTYDAHRQAILGYYAPPQMAASETWLWNGTTWTNLA